MATIREGEAGAGNDLVGALEARRAVVSIDVCPLDRSQSEAVLRECLAVEIVPADLLDAVVARSDGIPFFIEELLATALADPIRCGPSQRRSAPRWRAASARLPDGTAQLLRYAAVLGPPVRLARGCRRAAMPARGRDRRLRQAASAQLIDTAGGAFRFRHALTVEAVQDSAAPRRTASICAELSRDAGDPPSGPGGGTLPARRQPRRGSRRRGHAAELWLDAARRALGEGSLASAEALALRARAARPLEADRVLLSTWALAGQPRRALEAGERILASSADPAVAN